MNHRLLNKTSLLVTLLCLAGLLLPISAYAIDTDNDTIDDSVDNCPLIANATQKDWDQDGSGDVCDTDDDNDTYPDISDAFPRNAAEWLDTDNDNIGNNADTDDDNDMVPDTLDNCPINANASQVNTDLNFPNGDTAGNACDDDDDADGVLDINDAFPINPNEWSDRDGDGTGDNTDTDNDNDRISDILDDDDDNDTINDFADPPTNSIILDNCHWIANKDQKNSDADADGDACDTDDDNDGYLDINDAFPTNPLQWLDTDGDGVGDNNSTTTPADPQGDVFPSNPAEWADSDGDGNATNLDPNDDYGDNRDPDDDNDGIPDRIELKVEYGLNPFDASDAAGDPDGDTFTYLQEYHAGSLPKVSADTPNTRLPKQYKMVTTLGFGGNSSENGDKLGSSIATLANYTVIGAPNGHLHATLRGGAHLFTTADSGASWQQSINFIPLTNAHTRLGKTVAIASDGSAGNHIFLSADGDNNAGVVYLYDTSGALLQTLTADSCTSATPCPTNQGFGNSIVVDGDTALISAPGTKPTTSSGSSAGAVYVYRRNGSGVWQQEAKLIGDDTAQHFFGSSIALELDRAVIGASGVNSKGANTGKVYVFERTGTLWNRTASLIGSNTSGGDYFGSSVALNGTTLVVGATGTSSNGSNSGTAYIFTLSGGVWSEPQPPLTAPDATPQLFFGYNTLMTDADTLMIGTPLANGHATSNSGAIYIYRLVTGLWTYNGKLQSHDRQTGDYFGTSFAYNSGTNSLLVGAPGVDDSGDGAGAAYSVDLTGINSDTDGDKIADAFDNCPGPSNTNQNDIDGDGQGDACDADIDDDGHNNGSDVLTTYPSHTTPDGDDKFSFDPSEWANSDTDNMGDNIDPDADNDGIPDNIEIQNGLNWLDGTDAAGVTKDRDSDGYDNLTEYLAGTDINSAADHPGNLASNHFKLVTKDGTLNDSFGNSVAISGNYAIIGAIDGKNNGIASGAAYIFKRDTLGKWSQMAKLIASDPAHLARFGSSVAILDSDLGVDGGELALVGAPGVTNSGYVNSGAAYIFQHNGIGIWTLITDGRLTATSTGTNHNFGSSVAIGSTTQVVVGAPGAHKNSALANTGAAHLFELNTGTWQETKLVGLDSKGGDGFGSSVALANDHLMVGSPNADGKNYASGAVYRFRRTALNSWSEKTKLVATDGLSGDQFGSSISLRAFVQFVSTPLIFTPPNTSSANIAFGGVLVGAPGRDGKGANSGAAYLFEQAPTSDLGSDPAWSQQAKLEARGGAKTDSLGQSVAYTFTVDSSGYRSSTAVLGAQLRDGKQTDSGSAYLFSQAPGLPWVEQSDLIPRNGKSRDYFGSSVAIYDKERVLIGATGVDDNAIDAGAAYVVSYSDLDNPAETNEQGAVQPDGIYTSFDNCPNTYNPEQTNTDKNFATGSDNDGDACDLDDDGDGRADSSDAFPFNPDEKDDTDNDGIGNNADKDDDGDGIPDTREDAIGSGLSSTDPTDAAKDNDGDGLTNLEEFTGGSNINDPDSDKDGATDGEEIDFGTKPMTWESIYGSSSYFATHRPKQPLIKPIASPLLLSSRTFDSYAFVDVDNDPDDGVIDYMTQGEWQINSAADFPKSGRILRRLIRGATSPSEEEKVRRLTIAAGILMPGERYWIRTRHYDGLLWSEWSAPVEFTMSTEGDHDLNKNQVDDRYEAGTGFDANGDGKIDKENRSEMSIVPLYNTGNSAIIGLQLSRGDFSQLTAVAYNELPATVTADGRMPYGLFNFRIVNLEANPTDPEHVTVTFYLPEAPTERARWFKYNPTSGTLTDMKTDASFLDKRVSVTLVDGGEFDADGVVNGIVVDPSGLYIPLTDEEKLSNYSTGAFSPWALLGLVLCWPLRRLTQRPRAA